MATDSDTKPRTRTISISQERVENVSDLIGPWGPMQKRIFTVLAITYVASPFNNASLFYYVLKSDLWCQLGDGRNINISSDKCSFNELKSCSSWGHNTTRITITKEWNLVCEDYWLRSLALSAYQFGYLISGIVIGIFSDRYGRRAAIIFCISLEICCSICLTLSPSIYVFISIRVLHGIGGFGRYLASLILILENVAPNLRGRMVVCYDWIWYIVEYIMMFTAYKVLNFRYIYLGTAVYQTFSLCIVAFIPESPRWQLVTGRSEQAEKTLRKYSAKRRQSQLPGDLFDAKLAMLRECLQKDQITNQSNQRKMGILDLWRQPKISRFCGALYIEWFIMAFIGHGLMYSTLDLSGDIFINNAIFLIAGIASNAFMTWKVDSFHRRTMLIVVFLMTAVLLCGSIGFIDSHEYIVPRMILVTSGRFFASALFIIIYVYTPEVFPTNIRHLGVGSCSVAARLASMSAPFVSQLASQQSLKLTYGLFSLVCMIGAGVATLLPETKGKEIPDSIEDMLEMHSPRDAKTRIIEN